MQLTIFSGSMYFNPTAPPLCLVFHVLIPQAFAKASACKAGPFSAVAKKGETIELYSVYDPTFFPSALPTGAFPNQSRWLFAPVHVSLFP